MKEKGNISGIQYFLLGLLIFLMLGMDMFIMGLDQWLWGDLFNIDDFFVSPWYVLVVHWSIVTLLWAVGAMMFLLWFRKRKLIGPVISLCWSSKVIPLLIVAFISSFLFAVLEFWINGESIPQIYREYENFKLEHGFMGIWVGLVQNIYYIVEAVLVVLLVALMQRAGEVWFKNPSLPYGGIGLMLTWGLGHLTHGLQSGLYITAFSLVFGWLFVKAGKQWWPSFLFIWLVFVL
ncbi:hypothetical protein [Paenibacillus sp. FSL H3-0286]|uniref:hypothetical protein n=1 Tax=Paenibacillus sp. FSL H3-0286 TaxID=2921427 RepID=UPI00324877B4